MRRFFCCSVYNLEKQRRKSSIIIVIISIIFVLSEVPHLLELIYTSKLFNFTEAEFPVESLFDSYNLLSWELGFSLNFVVYLIMSKRLRQVVKQNVKTVTKCCWYNNATSDRRYSHNVYIVTH